MGQSKKKIIDNQNTDSFRERVARVQVTGHGPRLIIKTPVRADDRASLIKDASNRGFFSHLIYQVGTVGVPPTRHNRIIEAHFRVYLVHSNNL